MSLKPPTSEKRKLQLRESQRRRREMLAAGARHQVNVFLSKEAIYVLDQQCSLSGQDRHDLLNDLILHSFK